MGDFHGLEAWERSHRLTLEIYRATADFPKHEIYGLSSQMRRAATSIGANLAEGCGRKNDGDLRRFAQIARGSVNELNYLLLISKDLGYLAADKCELLSGEADRISKMLNALIVRVNRAAGGK